MFIPTYINKVDGQYETINEELEKKVKELEAKLTLASVKEDSRELDPVKEKEWRRRITELEEKHSALEMKVLEAMSCQRVLALRQRLRTSALSRVADLAHSSSYEPIEQMATEDHITQSVHLDAKVFTTWNNWDESRKHLQIACNQAVSEFPELSDFIDKINMQSELRQVTASSDLRYKLLAIEDGELNVRAEYMSGMPNMLKKLYLAMKDNDKVTPGLTEDYVKLMKKAKSGKSLTWSDSRDSHFELMLNLDLEKPSSSEDSRDRHFH